MPTTEASTEPTETASARPFVVAAPAPQTVDLAAAEAAPAPRVVVDLVKAPAPGGADRARPGPRQAPPSGTRPSPPAGCPRPGPRRTAAEHQDATAADRAIDPRVDTAELQKIWDLGEAAARTRSGRGRRVRVGAEVDALPDRPRNIAGHRRRARHRA